MTAWRNATPAELEARSRVLASVSPIDPMSRQGGHSGVPGELLGLPEVSLIRGDSVSPVPIRWLWDGWLAAGKFHVLAGSPGTGKTTLALEFAAIASRGGKWPDGSDAAVGNVVIWSGEDDPKDVLVPRLQAMGADMARVFFVGSVLDCGEIRSFDPATDLAALEVKVAATGNVRLFVVDPIVSAVSGDSHKNAETRRALQPLVNLAQRFDCAVLGISHFTKGTSGRDPVERVTGSLAFGALPRVVMIAAKMPEDRGDHEPARIFARSKSNIGPDAGGFEYDLRYDELEGFGGLYATRVVWGSYINGSARELLATAEHADADGGGQNAKEFLEYLLAPGPMRASEVFRDAEAHGFNKRQMQRARAALGAHIEKDGMRGGWEWSLPKMPSAHEDAEDAEQNGVTPSAPSASAKAYRKVRG